MAAVVVAAVPTWEELQFRLDPGAYVFTSCIGMLDMEGSLLDPLRGDLDYIWNSAEMWVVPPLLVFLGFFACLRHRDPRIAGRYLASALGSIAIVGPLTPVYSSSDGCGIALILSAEWFDSVLLSWDGTLYILASAVLVLFASQIMPSAEGADSVPRLGTAWLRLLAVLIDYFIIVVVFVFVIQPIGFLFDIDSAFPSIHLDFGLLNWLSLFRAYDDPWRLLGLVVLFLYFWVQHARWGRTIGKRLLRFRVVSAGMADPPGTSRAAFRALVFPLLLAVPVAGPIILIADGLWALFDPDGRTLHDRCAGTDVTRRVPVAQPQA
ncbi:hypothetical protein Aph01nite_77000 [Acrocarpospora phusangensis]|uniref:RDD domain-containing protein n=1 Tax=Acrocarpospora phusangensis TaxID=1070424 RepID=A0A919UVG3_9ACTN|nr:RDD family protein [Acrocarpospora phusangensis]GIH29390.1 hypothetical protein Aph01nite_77000 [Acrocarpospora phusangensis]